MNASARREVNSERRLLLFDRDPVSSVLVEACLGSLGCKLLCVTKETEAEQALATWRPDLVVLEASREGLHLLRNMRESAQYRHTPSVMLVAVLEREIRLRAV